MPTVDFYVLNEPQKNPWQLACQMIEKIYADSKSIYVHVNSQKEAEHLDELLWTFNDISFLPHKILTDQDDSAAILIGYQENLPVKNCLINLANAVPAQFNHFEKVVEFVFPDANMQQLAREHFKFYRGMQCELNTIKYNNI